MNVCTQERVFIFDLDGTLISESTSLEIYRIVYEETVKEIEKRGYNVPLHLRKHGEKWIEAFSLPFFKQIFDEIYIRFIENYDFIKEKKRVERILSHVMDFDCVKKIYVLSDNPFAKRILEYLGLYYIEVIETDKKRKTPLTLEEYYEEYIRVKTQAIKNIKKSCETCEIVYVGDLPADELVAEFSGVKYLSIRDLEISLNL